MTSRHQWMPAKKKALKPVNLSAIAKEHGLTRETVRKWRDEGLDIASPKAIKARMENMRRQSPALEGESLSEARRRKMVADANRSELLTRKERGEFVQASTAAAAIELLTRHVEIVWKQLPRELPGRLEGLSPADMMKVITHHVDRELIPRLNLLIRAAEKDMQLPPQDLEAYLQHAAQYDK